MTFIPPKEKVLGPVGAAAGMMAVEPSVARDRFGNLDGT
jgi:hypothetical protein